MKNRSALRFKRLSDGEVFNAEGRVAQTLTALVDAGQRGVTALEISTWALRLSDYVFKAKRRFDLDIEMTLEPHVGGDGNQGLHGRYRLVTPIQIIKTEPAGGAP